MTKLTKPNDILRAAADVVENIGWSVLALARNINGDPVNTRSLDACCYCALGAIYLVSDNLDDRASSEALLQNEAGKRVMAWNDSKGQTAENVANTMRRAAEKYEAMQEAQP